jgi:hypothetical protein
MNHFPATQTGWCKRAENDAQMVKKHRRAFFDGNNVVAVKDASVSDDAVYNGLNHGIQIFRLSRKTPRRENAFSI